MSHTKAILFGPLPPPYGGVSVFMSALKNACIHRGVEVWSYAGDSGDKRVIRVDHRKLGHLRRLRGVGPGTRIVDSTHFHLEYPHWLLLPLWLRAKRRRGFKWVKVCHDGSLPSRYAEMSKADRERVSKAVRAVDELVVTSPDLVGFFRNEFGRDAKYISPLMPLPTALDKDVGNPRATQVVISIGAFIPSYGFHHVVAAVERLRLRGKEIGLILLDGAFARDEHYRQEVLMDRSWITVHEGVPHDKVSGFLADSGVFVRAFEHESYGLSRVEAIMSGTRVIATNIGETRGMRTYEFGDVDTLTAHLATVLHEKAELDLEHWQEVYRREAEQNLKAYLQLITGGSDA